MNAIKRKQATISSQIETIQEWKQQMVDMELYDAQYEEEKYLIKEINLIEYILSALELMAQVKGNYTDVSFLIALNTIAEMRKKKSKILLTSFLKSFALTVDFSNELSYFSIILQPQLMAEKSPLMVQFYLKLRKYIYSNFTNDRDAVIKPLTFEQWVSVVSKFLDNSAISIIGNRIKEEVVKTKNNDKILKNNVLPFDLLRFCFELYMERNPVQTSAQATPEREVQNKFDSQPIKPNAQQIAYKIMMPKEKPSPSPQTKSVLQKTVEIHEDLAYHYKLLANYTTDFKIILAKFVQKIKSQQPISEAEVKELEAILRFNQFVPQDPEITLKESGIYDLL